MAYARPSSPYDATPLVEIPLEDAPLVRVLAQVRHPALRVLTGEGGTATALGVANKLSDEYPIFEPIRESAVFMSPDGIKEDKDQVSNIWRLRSADELWQISIGSEFVALETKAYGGRQQFHERLHRFLVAYATEVKPPSVSRIGIRYTNRISPLEHPGDISDLIQPELKGPIGSSNPDGVELVQSFCQVKYATTTGGSILNWGFLPPGAIFDLNIPAVPHRSWFLDIDVFSNSHAAFTPDDLAETINGMALRAYAHFRWAVTERFLETFKEPR